MGKAVSPLPHTTNQSPDPDPVKLGTGLEHPGAPSEIPGKPLDTPLTEWTPFKQK